MSAVPIRTASAVGVAGRRNGPWLAAIVGAALIIRLIPALNAPPYIAWPDGREFQEMALSLLRHDGYGLNPLRPPGYPTFMAAVWSVTGPSLAALRTVEAVLGALTVWGIAWVALRRFGVRAGWIAGALAAVHPVLAYLPSTQYSENTLLALMVAAFGALLAALAPGGRRLKTWALAGALLGLAMLWRPNIVLVMPGLIAGTVWLLARDRRAFLAPVLCLVLAAGAVLAPWVIRCHHVHGRWYFVATGGGRALWLGSNPQIAGGRYTITVPDPATLRRVTARPGEFAYDAAMRREALAHARAHPAGAVVLYGRKLAHLYALWPATVTPSPYLTRRTQAAQGLITLLIYAGALLGLSRLRHTPSLWPLVAGVISFSLLTAMFFSVMRYRMPVEPVLIWLAALGWANASFARRPAER